MRRLALGVLFIVLAVWGLWLFAAPGDEIEAFAERKMSGNGARADLVGFEKGLFYSFRAEALDVFVRDVRAFTVEGLRGGLDIPASVWGLGAVVALEGRVSGGALDGRLAFTRRGYRADLTLSGAELGGLGVLDLPGAGIAGSLDAEAHVEDGSGTLRFEARGIRISNFRYEGFELPPGSVQTVRGALGIRRGGVDVESVSLEGKGLYARARGAIVGDYLDLKVELMPDDDAYPDALLSALIGRYRVSKGNYLIPVRQRLRL